MTCHKLWSLLMATTALTLGATGSAPAAERLMSRTDSAAVADGEQKTAFFGLFGCGRGCGYGNCGYGNCGYGYGNPCGIGYGGCYPRPMYQPCSPCGGYGGGYGGACGMGYGTSINVSPVYTVPSYGMGGCGMPGYGGGFYGQGYGMPYYGPGCNGRAVAPYASNTQPLSASNLRNAQPRLLDDDDDSPFFRR